VKVSPATVYVWSLLDDKVGWSAKALLYIRLQLQQPLLGAEYGISSVLKMIRLYLMIRLYIVMKETNQCGNQIRTQIQCTCNAREPCLKPLLPTQWKQMYMTSLLQTFLFYYNFSAHVCMVHQTQYLESS
jgi:hypothetical protein